MEDLEYFKKEILDHYSELHNSLDIYTETILAKNDFTEEKIQDLNLKRKSLSDQMEMIKKCNLDNLEKNLLENVQILSKYKQEKEKDIDEENYDDYDPDDYDIYFESLIAAYKILFKDGFCDKINYKQEHINELIFIIWPHYLKWDFLQDIKYNVFDRGLYSEPSDSRISHRTHNFVEVHDFLLANLVYYGFKNLERSRI
ncbi:hypothetical protein BpHYR1_045253 [Brachionus plicatilis]|uniref:Uncharacterized protein n=1 Tax=Brachionus plicatilis TaxID=10195 RepID=A0A3M7QJ34_BRAPC|nr:hypothetical protein BpHYR1_045253 [Brachionus plicatilis]